MTKLEALNKWQWWAGPVEERFETRCDSREEAIQVVRDEYGDGGWITEAVSADDIRLSAYFDANMFIENSEDNVYGDFGDPENDTPIFDISQDHTKSLEEHVRAAIDLWQDANDLKFKGFIFLAARNTEFIPAKEQEA